MSAAVIATLLGQSERLLFQRFHCVQQRKSVDPKVVPAQVSAAIATSLGRGEPPRVKVSPVEWFVADEPETHTRYFVIQGSDNFDHWKVPHAASPRLLSPSPTRSRRTSVAH